MSNNRIAGNYGSLNIVQNNESTEGRKDSVTQIKQNFTVGKNNQNSLTSEFEKIQRMVEEKTTPCFKNRWKNFWNGGREESLNQIKNALNVLKNISGELTLDKLENNAHLFNTALNNKALSQETRNALESLVDQLKVETGIYFKKTYSKEQLKTMFYAINPNTGKPIGKGAFGKVYAGSELVFKVIKDEVAFEGDVKGNKAFKDGSENFSKNKEIFYRQSNALVTDYVGSFTTEGGETSQCLNV